MTVITPSDFKQAIAVEQNIQVIDVRTPAEFTDVHVTCARNEPLDALKPENLGLSPARAVYLLCQSGGRARKAAEIFERCGFTSVSVVDGGTVACTSIGMPLQRGTVRVISLERQVRIAAGAMVLMGVLLARFVHPSFIWLSAFVGAGLVFAGITDWCGMGLLLARAPWNQRKS